MALRIFTLTVIKSVEMDFSLWRRRQNLSSSSDNSSPPAPSLQSPAAYHTSIANIAKATLRQRIKSDHFVDMPPMFPEDADYEDDRVSCNLRRCAPVEAKPAHVPQTGVLEGDISTRSIISQYFKNAFRPREQQNPPQLQEGPDSVTVFEIKLNTKVCSIPGYGNLILSGILISIFRSGMLNLIFRTFHLIWLRSSNDRNILSWLLFSRTHSFSLGTQRIWRI